MLSSGMGGSSLCVSDMHRIRICEGLVTESFSRALGGKACRFCRMRRIVNHHSCISRGMSFTRLCIVLHADDSLSERFDASVRSSSNSARTLPCDERPCIMDHLDLHSMIDDSFRYSRRIRDESHNLIKAGAHITFSTESTDVVPFRIHLGFIRSSFCCHNIKS